MKVLSTIKEVLRPSWALAAVTAGVVCASTLVVLRDKPAEPVYPAVPMMLPAATTPVETANNYFPPPSNEESAGPLAPIEAPEVAVKEAPPAPATPIKKISKKRPTKKVAKISRKAPKKISVVVEPMHIPPRTAASIQDTLKAFEFLASTQATPAFVKRMKRRLDNQEVDRLVDDGLNEAPLLADYSQPLKPNEEDLKIAGEAIEPVTRNAVLFAEFEKTKFEDVKGRLAALKKESREISRSRPSPEVKTPKVEAALAAITASEQSIEPLATSENEIEPQDEPSETRIATTVKTNEPVEEPQDEPALVVPEKAEVTVPAVTGLFSMLAKTQLPRPRAPLATQNAITQSQNSQSTQSKPIEVAQLDRKSSVPKESLSSEDFIDEVDPSDAEALEGKFSVDEELDQELAEKKGHIELHLVPVNDNPVLNRKPFTLEYRYPSEKFGAKFSEPAGTLIGAYRLYANVYMDEKVAPIPYTRSLITHKTREHIRFHVTKSDYDHYFKYVANVPTTDLILNLSIFEGVQGNPKNPKRITGAMVKIVNLPEWGTFVSDKDGNVRIPKVPSVSKLMVEVSAPGYMPTDTIIPTAQIDKHAVVYLIPQDGVDSITKFFTKNPQQNAKSVVMGRAFDPTTRKLLAGEKFSLQYRKGPALYMNAFPQLDLMATTITGLFGFFNVTPSVRAVLREGANKLGYLLNIKPGRGYFLEFGRSGKRNIAARLFDTINGLNPEARVEILGQEGTELQTDGTGRFVIPDVDLPAGLLTVKVKNAHYPETIYSLPVDVSERAEESKLFMVESEWIKDWLHRGSAEKNRGMALGGAEASLFEGTKGCVKLELLTAEGEKVDPASGPFDWGRDDRRDQARCFSKDNPRFAFKNLPPGPYISRWVESETGRVLRSHVFFVAKDLPTMVIN